ncbi:MAG: hypothetical protein ACXACB_07830 [Promethearchaeota archaeon]
MRNRRLLKTTTNKDDSVFKFVLQQILSRAIKISSCQSVSIRLDEKGDFPFYVHEGYPNFFLLKENSLSKRDKDGHILYDKNDFQILDCMCGNVIRGHFDPAFPFFSKKGSFWTNNTTNLLSCITKEQRKFIGPTRNMCNYSGYESVALIPLKTDGTIVGLIHLADPRENMFTIKKISEIEKVADEFAAIIKHVNKITEKLLKIDRIIQAAEN